MTVLFLHSSASFLFRLFFLLTMFLLLQFCTVHAFCVYRHQRLCCTVQYVWYGWLSPMLIICTTVLLDLHNVNYVFVSFKNLPYPFFQPSPLFLSTYLTYKKIIFSKQHLPYRTHYVCNSQENYKINFRHFLLFKHAVSDW